MPRFPTYERSQGLGGGATASYASDGAFTAPARALANMGEAAFGLGSQAVAEEERAALKIRETQDDTWFSKARAETSLAMITAQQEAQKSATGEGQSYVPAVRGRFHELREAKATEAPSKRAAQMWQEWANSYDVELTGKAATFQAQSELAKRTSDFAEAMNAHALSVAADPSQYEVVHKRAMDDFEGAKQWMTPEQEAKARETVDRSLKLARAKSVPPEQLMAETGASEGRGDAASLLRKFEGYRDTPYWDVNAHRIGYGSDTVTRADGSVVRVTPGMKITQEDAERDLARRAAEFEGVARDQTGAREWGALPDNARAALVSVAYNYGKLPASVVSAVKAGDPAKVAASVEALAGHNGGVNANRRRQEAAIIRGAPIPNDGPMKFASDPRYAGLSVDEIMALQTDAQQAIGKREATQYASLKDQIDFGIATGQIMSEAAIIQSGLNGGDVATMLSKFRTAQDEGRNLAGAWAAFQDGTLALDSYDTKDRSLLDKMEASIPDGEEGLKQAWTNEAIRRSGIVPKGAVSDILRGLESGNAQEVAAAARRASQINAIDRAALAKRDNGSKAADAGTAFDHYVNDVGLTEEQAAQRLIDAKDPEKMKARASLMESKPIKDFIKNQATENAVRDIFDPGLGFDPELGQTPAEAAAMVGEYRAILEESLFDAAGDTDLAEQYAAERFMRLYRPSDLTLAGSGVVTRLPPEATYPAGPDGSHAYVREQAIEALRNEGIAAEEVFLQSDEGTDADFRAGRPAHYQVFYRIGDTLERFNLPFYAIPSAAQQDFSENRARFQQNRQDLLDGRDRERNLDSFLDGDPLTGAQ